jgi:AcrR family transcriptional regulator
MADRRQEIIDVARDLFSRHGVKQTTVREIGASAGILSGSLYHHFESKLDIVEAILRDFSTSVLERYRELEREESDAATRLRLMARLAFSLIHEHPESMVIVQDDYVDLTKDPDTKDPRFSFLVEFNDEVEQHWVACLKDGIDDGEFRDSIDPRAVYRFIRDAILGAIRWYRPTKEQTSDDLADSLVDIMLSGISTRPR